MKLLKSALFCIIGLLIIFKMQAVMMPKILEFEHEKKVLKGVKEIPPNTLDVIFVGVSQMDQGVSPMELYEDAGILSYNLATPGQPVAHSYYFLKQVLTRQAPKVVVLDVSALFVYKYDGHWRYGLDNMEFSIDKIELALEYEKIIEDGDRWNALFPILKYHTRITELTKKDFKITKPGSYYSAGQHLCSSVQPPSLAMNEIDDIVDRMMFLDPGFKKYIEDGELNEETINGPVYSIEIPEYYFQFFLKIKSLCEENDSQLLLVKIPSYQLPNLTSTAWTRQKYLFTKELADKYDVPFFDMMYDADIGIDLQTDSPDGGWHPTNIRGAEKITKALENYLIKNYDLERKNSPEYDKALTKYKKVREIALLQSEMDFDTYIERLVANKDKWTILIAANDEHKRGLDKDNYKTLESLGLTLSAEGLYGASYAAVIERGSVKYEAISDRQIVYDEQLNGIDVDILSSGWFTNPTSHIIVNGQYHSPNKRGLNFVIYDHESEMVIDSVCFDTWESSKPATRYLRDTDAYLRGYESVICKD